MPIEQALTGIDGLMLTGGGDVAPSRYGEARSRDG
jgi:gamma-glutamyl-gamma-aminobutyrate hydrolase PuuD